VARLLLLAERVGALGAAEPAPVEEVDGIAFARRAAAEGSVLLANDGILPLDPAQVGKVAVIGHNAVEARTQGGGSATVVPERVVTPLDGIRAALPEAEVTYSLGAVVSEGVGALDAERLTNPRTGGRGVTATFLAADRTELFTEDRFATSLTWFGGEDGVVERAETLVLETVFTPADTERRELGFATSLRGRVYVDGELLFEDQPEKTAQFAVAGAISVTFGTAPLALDAGELIAEAARAAAEADVAVVVVGTNSRVESEGYDRDDLDLPGHQDALVAAVAKANPRTVVVVNSGSPVLLPWRGDVAAVLLGYFGGQEFGNAVADVLVGAAEPGGRLPTTWPAQIEDVPVLDCTPDDEGRLHYAEGVHVGYRAWLKAGTTPAYPFGHGLGYTTWGLSDLSAEAVDGGAEVRVVVANTGGRAGKQVVQVYASRADTAVDRPRMWLVGFAPVRVDAGDSREVTVRVPRRRFEHYDDGWRLEPGAYRLHVGTSLADLVAEAEVELS
jgi:beta-glucosidase